MPEEFGLGIEDGEGGESGGEKVSEEAQQRARDDTAKAKQVRQQIKQIQQQNTQFAVMLSLLLQMIDDDNVLGYVFTQLIDQKVPTPAIFAQFLPHLQHHMDIATYKPLYGTLREQLPHEDNVSSLVKRLKQVRAASGALKNISIKEYLPFVLAYLQWMKAVDLSTMEDEQQTVLKKSIKKELA